MENIRLKREEIAKIRRLDDFDLTMLISDIDQAGWTIARDTLAMMPHGEARPSEEAIYEPEKNS